MRPAPHEAHEPTDADLEAAGAVIAAQAATLPYLVYLRDKALLFDEDRKGFVMYGVQGRTWVALGDPVGPPDRLAGLIRLFLERCDDFGGVPVFYEVGKEGLHRYADFGLTFVKLGEEARVDLSLVLARGRAGEQAPSGAAGGSRRRAGRFRVIPAAEVPRRDGPAASGLRRLAARARPAARRASRSASSIPATCARFPVARRRAPGAHRGLRQPVAGARQARALGGPHALPPGRAEGRDGSALRPPPALGQGAGLPLVRARHGAAVRLRERRRSRRCGRGWAASSTSTARRFYNFQGLRAYKEKFNPMWEPRYLAYPGGLALPRILADVAALDRRWLPEDLPEMTRGFPRVPAVAAACVAISVRLAGATSGKWLGHDDHGDTTACSGLRGDFSRSLTGFISVLSSGLS